MLEELNITNLGIVEDTSLPFTPGLNVLTGETGAGKSMILNGLGLLLGARAKSGLVGAGQTQLTVEGCWAFEDSLPSFLEERNATVEDGQLFVSRSVKSDGKSRAVVGGRSLPVSVLSEISSQLVSIHGQSDQLKLKSASEQLKILDSFGGDSIREALTEYRALYSEWVKLKKTLKDFQENSAAREQERDFYQGVVDEFEKINPQEGEEEELRNLVSRLENIDAIRESMNTASSMLSNDDDNPDLTSLAYLTYKAVEAAARMDESLSALSERAMLVHEELREINDEVSSYIASIDYEAIESLNEAQERLVTLSSLNRKYRQPDLEASLVFYAQAAEKLISLSALGSAAEIEEALEEVQKNMETAANKLTAVRQEWALKLSEGMNEALSELNMSGAVFLISVTEGTYGSSGRDIAEFMLKAHKKAEASPVSKTASGGELSRIMLALETVTAKTDQLTTFVFDEVDSGVGGETAVQIGKRLAELAKTAQVIVVTHLPQVASFADNHLLIQKTADDESVSTSVKQLDQQERREEIARMLSGLSSTGTGLAHADELLEFAGKWKSE